jgi:hypothetical protein
MVVQSDRPVEVEDLRRSIEREVDPERLRAGARLRGATER